MFPIPFNFPFRKKDGSVVSLSKAIEDGGGSYELPTASAEIKGGVKVGDGLEIDENAVLSVSGGSDGALSFIKNIKNTDSDKTATIPEGKTALLFCLERSDTTGYHLEKLIPIDFAKKISAYNVGGQIVLSDNNYLFASATSVVSGNFMSVVFTYDDTTRKVTIINGFQNTGAVSYSCDIYAM